MIQGHSKDLTETSSNEANTQSTSKGTSPQISTKEDGEEADMSKDPTAEGNVAQTVEPRRSKRSTKGAPPTRYGTVVTHKMVYPYFQLQSKL